jgi:hypothetical protein
LPIVSNTSVEWSCVVAAALVPEGIGVYPAPPSVTDASERGQSTGQRVESVTYVCEKPGTYRIPGLTLAWWDAKQKTLRRQTLPSRLIEVAGTAAPAEEPAAPPRPAFSLAGWIALVVGIASTAMGLWFLRRPLLAWWHRRQADPATAERVYFSRFRQACQGGDAPQVYQALMVWLDHLGSGGPGRLTDLLDSEDSALRSQLDGLQRNLFGPPGSAADWSSSELFRLVSAARTRLKEEPDIRPQGTLPPLNPQQ